ncbi:asparagine synthase-related protein, partial [Georgenia subflava]
MADASDDRFARVTEVEAAISWPLGRLHRQPAHVTGTARQVLEDVVLRSLAAPGPTFVTFSGGRDSSAVLAVATQVARREGLALPVPVTAVFPGVPESDESQWQELVLSHLRLTERIVLTIDDEQRWLGEPARTSLRRRGLLWPAAVHLDDLLFAQMAGGRLLTGEGGDAVLGPHRVTPLSLVLRERRRPDRGLLAAALRAALPATGRAAAMRAAALVRPAEPWLRGRA